MDGLGFLAINPKTDIFKLFSSKFAPLVLFWRMVVQGWVTPRLVQIVAASLTLYNAGLGLDTTFINVKILRVAYIGSVYTAMDRLVTKEPPTLFYTLRQGSCILVTSKRFSQNQTRFTLRTDSRT